MSAKIVDTLQRQRIVTDLDKTLVVEAAAGTGKTTALVRRIVAVLREGRATVDSIVAVTFTEKAAGELKLRLRAALETERHQVESKEQKAALERALARLEEARVGTIHGFCADLLRERSIEAAVDPQFVVLTEPEAPRVFAEAFDLWLQWKLEDPPPGVRRSLRRVAGGDAEDDPVGRLRSAGWTLTEWRDFQAPWRRDAFDREAVIDDLVRALGVFREISAKCGKPRTDGFYVDTEPGRRLFDEIQTTESVRERDYDGLEGALIDLVSSWRFRNPKKGYGRVYGDGVMRSQVHEAHARLVAALENFKTVADADLAALLQQELFEVVSLYEELKERTGKLDFVDLLLRTRNLVRDCAPVRADFQRRFSHVFIDEFQDTDPLQAEILLLLAAADPEVSDWRSIDPVPGKLFLVADPKQSIYRFRRADVGTYLDVKEMLLARGADEIQLTTSFRGVRGIQNAVNTAFSRHMDGDRSTLQADYVPLSPRRADPDRQPTVIALPVPRPYGWRRYAKNAIEASLPEATAAFAHWLIRESGWTVTERENPEQRVPIEARHICLLFRRFDSHFAGDVTRPYVQALEARDVRHLLVGGRSFHEREEVTALRTALRAIEWPDDELSVFATLHGTLFAIGDTELLEFRRAHHRLHPFRRPSPADVTEPAILDALELLARLHRGRNERPVAETVNLLLEHTRAHAGFVLRPSGEQALANVLYVAEQARVYESTGGISFRGFVQRLDEDAQARAASEAPILEEGSDGVRLMTVHRAKGLEFPVVILADPGASLARTTAGRAVDAQRNLCAVRIGGWAPIELLEAQQDEVARDMAEGVRLAYVAATRARDLLVIPGLGDGPDPNGGWLAPLNDAIYPPAAQWDHPEPAVGCPAFGHDSVLERPHDLAFGIDCVRPGRHRFGEADTAHDVVWWDPAQLVLDLPRRFGLRQEELLSREAAAEVVEADKQQYLQWRDDRARTLESAALPTLPVRTATQQARLAMAAPARAVSVVELDRDADRPAGPRFGALVHAVLASVELTAGEEQIEQMCQFQGRVLGATDAERAAAAKVVGAVLGHGLLDQARKAAQAGQCRRETPVTLRDLDGTVVDGVVDLAFRAGDSWVVIDFKTDRELETQLDLYRAQVALYADAIETATGLSATAVLMRV